MLVRKKKKIGEKGRKMACIYGLLGPTHLVFKITISLLATALRGNPFLGDGAVLSRLVQDARDLGVAQLVVVVVEHWRAP